MSGEILDPSPKRSGLSRGEARRFYDRFGARQDRQAFYEDAALDVLVERGGFESARAVVEFGCGTGRFAERLLRERLGEEATYRGFDQSATMVALARSRIAAFGRRAEVFRTDGSMALDLQAGSCDRFVSSYVIEILSPSDRAALVNEAHRLLEPGGRLCLIVITPGHSPLSRAVMGVWNAVYSLRPRTFGGCRPVVGAELLDEARWRIEHRQVISRWGIASEILVARRREA